MFEIGDFSNLLSQFSSLVQPPSARQQDEESRLPVLSGSTQSADVFQFSRLASNHPASSFDRVDPVAVVDTGTYSPSAVQESYRFGLATSFEFNLSVQRQTSLISQPRPGGRGDVARLSALESRSLAYQLNRSHFRQDIGGSFRDMRRFETELFYSRTRELSAQLDTGGRQRHGSASRKVARTFEFDLSLEISFLSQFIRQSEGISGLDVGLFEQYLGRTDSLAGPDGQALQAFFDDVDHVLEDTEAFLQGTLESFFQRAAKTFGLAADELEALRGLASNEVTAFFDDVDHFLAEAQSVLAEFGGVGQLDEPESEEAVPAVEQAVETPPVPQEPPEEGAELV